MSTPPLPGPISVAIPTNGGFKYPNPGKACFSCGPPYDHLREWKPNPDIPGRERTLVLCFDGTGDSFDQDNSNVVQLLAMLMKDDPTKQLVYYQAGIGTYTSNVLKTSVIEKVSNLRNKMFARDLSEHVKDGYKFLMQNYNFGDKICIFGFSRGAFTARALAGMLQKIGLLPSSNLEQLPFAYAMYERDDEDGLKLSIQFKRTFSIDVRIEFLGVWDTVQSVGWFPKDTPFCKSNNAIAHFRHALALDERRVKFAPTPCTATPPKKQKDFKIHKYEEDLNGLYVEKTDVKEVFFVGAHCDVGGGSVPNGERNSLARIPLRWMIRECFRVNTGIIFDAHMLKNEVGFDVDSISKAPPQLSSETRHLKSPDAEPGILRQIPAAIASALYSPYGWVRDKLSSESPKTKSPPVEPRARFKNESQEELEDALSPIYDQLEKHAYWKAMEWIPFIAGKQSDSESLVITPNNGKGRTVNHKVKDRGLMVHKSVRTRMLALAKEGEEDQYVPKIRLRFDENGEVRCLTRDEWLTEQHFKWVD